MSKVTSETTLPPLTTTGIAQIALVAVFGPLSCLAVLIRLVSRRIKRRPLALNDYLILLSLLFANAFGATSCVDVLVGGSGNHVADLEPSNLTTLLKTDVVALVTYSLAMTLLKLSVLCLYIDTFPLRTFLRVTYAVVFLVVSYAVAIILVTFLNCRPFEKTWNREVEGVCGSLAALNLAVVIANLILDVVVVALPMPTVWGLQMKPAKKAAIMGVFGVGILVCVFSALRIEGTVRISDHDFPYGVIWASIWGTLEAYVGVINACVPVSQPFFALLWRRVGGMGSSEQGYRKRESRKLTQLTAGPAADWEGRTRYGSSRCEAKSVAREHDDELESGTVQVKTEVEVCVGERSRGSSV